MVLDRQELEKFIDWLPDIANEERFFFALFDRKKYGAEKDRQLNRFLSKKEHIISKIEEIGGWKDSYALYIHPNPRDLRRGAWRGVNRIMSCLETGSGFNPVNEAMSGVQTSVGFKYVIDFDIDDPSFDLYQIQIPRSYYKVLRTRGGYHILVYSLIKGTTYANSFYSHLSKWSDSKGDNLIPVPGVSQGGFCPKFI